MHANPDTESEPVPSAPAWHALALKEVRSALGIDENGLSTNDALERRRRHGPNALPKAVARPAWKRLLAQFNNVLIHVLLVSGALALLLEHPIDAAVIFGVILVNALIGFVQEGRAEAAMASIDKMLPQTATVKRDGRWCKRPAEQLVPGDLIEIRDGDRAPADLRLSEAHGLRMEEAALTGESVPVSKSTPPVDEAAPLADRRNMAWSGTMVAGGQARGIVVGIGSGTEIGRISTLLGEVRQLTTPLLRQINRFGHQLTMLLLAVTAVTIATGMLLHDLPAADGFIAGVALMVGAIPEGLPAIITITLAIGMRRMAGRNAVIRRLPAVETLGSVTVICSDKTGTLTRNQLRAALVLLSDMRIRPDDSAIDKAVWMPLLRACALCNNAEPDGDGGDPIEVALLGLVEVRGVDIDALRRSCPRRELIPFSSSSKWMATVHDDGIMLKGAPETLLQHAASLHTRNGDQPLDREAWRAHLDALAGEGYRLLALGDASASDTVAHGHLPERLRLLGVVAFEDPLREGVAASIRDCHSAGIRVKMITGDHPDTARSVARALGLKGAARALTGPELDRLEPGQLIELADSADVFARTTSEHKLRLVEALQARGEVVAMTGDGANDAPALKRADIGVSMGIKGTEAAHEASEMVLTDDNFNTIVAGIEQGRGVYDNIRKALVFILPTNAAEALVILLAVVLGMALPLTPVQVLWVNMATAVTLALALAFEPVETDIMRQPPRDPRAGLITRYMIGRILYVSIFLATAVFLVFEWILADTGDAALARSVALNILVAGEALYLFNCRRWSAPSWTVEALLANPVAWLCVALLAGLQGLLTYWPPLQQVFGMTGLAAGHWALIGAVSLLLFALVELEKALWRRWRTARATGGRTC